MGTPMRLLAVLAPVTQVSVRCVRRSELSLPLGCVPALRRKGSVPWEVGCPGPAEGISTHYTETMVIVLLLR